MNLARIILPALLLIAAPVVRAQDDTEEEIKERMEANLKAIDALKKAGKVGETNKGYLEARTELTASEKQLVKSENEDRKAIYTILAKRAKTTVEKIGEARAAQIRQRSARGVWLQSPDGKWYQKSD